MTMMNVQLLNIVNSLGVNTKVRMILTKPVMKNLTMQRVLMDH